jgi:hypothetical protein
MQVGMLCLPLIPLLQTPTQQNQDGDKYGTNNQ